MLDLPYGWITESEAEALYGLACNCRGDILEVGSFVGRSTCAIGYGIRASGRKNRFVSTDLHMNTLAELLAFYDGVFSPQDKPTISGEYLVALQRYLNEGGTEAALQRHLAERQLSDYVTLLKGDFREVVPQQKYELIFLDVTHTVEEIDRNMAIIASWVKEGTVVALHDVDTDLLKKAVGKHIDIEEVQQVQRLFVCRCTAGN